MAKTPRYKDEKLLEAVVRYADQYRGKIEATKLARWASDNVDGLQGVEGWHFTRPEEKTDPKTGKKIKKTKLCTAKINELNAARNTVTAMNANVLLKSANVDKFLNLPRQEQRQLIIETRAQVDKLIAENVSLRGENKAVAAKTQAVSAHVELMEQQLDSLKADHAKLLSVVTRGMETFDAHKHKKMLESIGVCDGLFDLDTYIASLTLRIDKVASINDIIRKNRVAAATTDVNSLMNGIEFE